MTIDALIKTLEEVKSSGVPGDSDLERVGIMSEVLDLRAIHSDTPQVLRIKDPAPGPVVIDPPGPAVPVEKAKIG